jgi:dTDP-4-amino-4,6-dideoxygalactose transaminase
MFKRIPPVGSPVLLTIPENPQDCLSFVFGNQSVFYYGSGTMALAAALIAAKKRKGVNEPEVLLPAYSCPDLISAAVYAGVKPILIDLEPETPWLDLNKLRGQISSRTIAVIAVHFLGIKERLAQIRNMLSELEILLIEDSAQLFPNTATAGVWDGDLVILSFGRGKPVSLLEGGAVICRDQSVLSHFSQAKKSSLTSKVIAPALKYRLKVSLYNQFLKPTRYGLLASLPFLHLGETRYKPLKSLDIAPPSIEFLLATNIEAYINRKLKIQNEISSMLKEFQVDVLVDLPVVLKNDRSIPLLRYPLLLKTSDMRNKVLDKLTQLGLGASAMYPTPLPAIDGLEDIFNEQDEFLEAERFSKRLLTLPCHPGVTSRDINRLRDNMHKLVCC